MLIRRQVARRKKASTGRVIADTAAQLFAERPGLAVLTRAASSTKHSQLKRRDLRPVTAGVIVAQPLPRIGQRVGPVLVASQKSSSGERRCD